MESILNNFYEYLFKNNNNVYSFITSIQPYNMFNKMEYNPFTNDISCQFNIGGNYLIVKIHRYTLYSESYINLNSPISTSVSDLNCYSKYISELSKNVSDLIEEIKKFVKYEL